ncbi:MAG TPA: NUDIX hydrolase, partial [Trueperaceae bacterium]
MIMADDILYQGKILDLVQLDGRWEVVRHAPAVCVLALRGQEVLGVTQPRAAIGTTTWEVPAGLIEPGEHPEEAARRELAEETQLSGRLRLITQFHTSPGFTDEKIYLFEATDVRAAEGRPDDTEDLAIRWREIGTAWHDIQAGRLQSSAATVVALTYALGRRGLLP